MGSREVEDRVSSEYLAVNVCGSQHFEGVSIACRRPQGRRDYHFLYIAEGDCYLGDGVVQERRVISPGSLLLFFPGEPQYYAFPAGQSSTSYFVHFSGVGCETLLAQAGLLEERVFFLGENRTLLSLLRRMVEEFQLAQPFFREMSVGYVQELIALIGRMRSARIGRAVPQRSDCIRALCRQMHRDYRREYPVAACAASCNLSESRFSHLFRANTGTSPHQYHQGVRMARACELLSETDLSIAQIAWEVGFGDQNYFSRSFKRLYGCSPSEFRRRE